jgi:hypothetical protein
MRLNDFIFQIKLDALCEAEFTHRYMPMVDQIERMKVPPNDPSGLADVLNSTVDQAITDFMKTAQWARKTFHTPPQISWYLRMARAFYMNDVLSYMLRILKQAGDKVKPVQTETVDRLRAMRDRSFKQDIPLDKVDSDPFGDLHLIMSGNTKARFEHFFSQGIPEVDSFNPLGLPIRDVNTTLERIEKKYNAQFGNTVRMRKDVLGDEAKELIKFSDGSAWFNLNKAVCSVEAKAMGHCGNSGTPQENDTILSYRTPVRGEHWSPHLTFILNTQTGMLGEMKGRNNDKPIEKYHKYIIALLKLPLIKGISGGGYMPENNFTMADLPEEQARELVKMKPLLADLMTLYMLAGNKVNAAVQKKLNHIFKGYGEEAPQYDRKENGFVIARFKDLDDAVEEVFGSDSLMYKILQRESDFGQNWDLMEPDLSSAIDLWDDLPDYLHTAALKYAKEMYPDAWEDRDDDDLIDILDDENDELVQGLKNAITDGMQSGAQGEAYKSAIRHLEQFGSDDQYKIVHDRNLDAPAYVLTTDVDFVLQNAEYIAREGSGMRVYDIDKQDLDEPYNGWTDYDDKYAKERAEENVYEIVSNYIPAKVKKQLEAKRKAEYKAQQAVWAKQKAEEEKKNAKGRKKAA